MNIYTKLKIVTASNILSFIAAIAGIVFLILGMRIFLIVCAIVTLVDSVIQVTLGDQNGFFTEIAMVAIGGILAIFKLDFLTCAAAALCIETAALTLIGLLVGMIRGNR